MCAITLYLQLPKNLIHHHCGRQERYLLYDQDTPSVALIGQPTVQHFPPIPLQNREANVLACIHRPLASTINQRDTLVATINKRETLMKIYLLNRDHPVMKILLNQGEHPNLMHV